MSSCEWEWKKARSEIRKFHIPVHTLLPYEIKIIYFRCFWDLSWQRRYFLQSLDTGNIYSEVFLPCRFYFKKLVLVPGRRWNGETTADGHQKWSALDATRQCSKTAYNAWRNTKLLSEQSGMLHTLHNASHRYKPKLLQQQRLEFLLTHSSTSLRAKKRYRTSPAI